METSLVEVIKIEGRKNGRAAGDIHFVPAQQRREIVEWRPKKGWKVASVFWNLNTEGRVSRVTLDSELKEKNIRAMATRCVDRTNIHCIWASFIRYSMIFTISKVPWRYVLTTLWTLCVGTSATFEVLSMQTFRYLEIFFSFKISFYLFRILMNFLLSHMQTSNQQFARSAEFVGTEQRPTRISWSQNTMKLRNGSIARTSEFGVD